MKGGELAAEGGLVVKGRASIDTRPPFRSVKEAVSLFGEVVLAGEIYANVNKQVHVQQQHHRDKAWQSINAELAAGNKTTVGQNLVVHQKVKSNDIDHQPPEKEVPLETELEETKASLQRAREEGERMYSQVQSLQKELDRAKTELQRLKSQKHYHHATHFQVQQQDHHHHHQEETSSMMMNPEIEEIKFVENNNSNNTYAAEWRKQENVEDDDDDGFEFPQTKKMQVRFASPPSLIRELSGPEDKALNVVNRVGSFRKEMSIGQKKASVSFVGWLFPKSKTKKTTAG